MLEKTRYLSTENFALQTHSFVARKLVEQMAVAGQKINTEEY